MGLYSWGHCNFLKIKKTDYKNSFYYGTWVYCYCWLWKGSEMAKKISLRTYATNTHNCDSEALRSVAHNKLHNGNFRHPSLIHGYIRHFS